MTRTSDLEKREASRKRLGSLENGAKSERAKKACSTERVPKLSRKRARTETEYLNGEQVSSKRISISQSPSRKVSRVGPLRKDRAEEDKLAANRGSKGLEPSTHEFVGTLWENGDAQGPDLPERKWKRTPKVANLGCLDSTSVSLRGVFGDQQDASEEDPGIKFAMEEEKQGKQKQSRENNVTRKSLRTVYLGESQTAGEKKTIAENDEASIGYEKEIAGITFISEQTALHGKDRKRREADLGDDSPPRPSEKKRRVHVAGAEASAEQGTWKRRKRHNKGNSVAASEDMNVSISEAWKRLRDWKDTETSGSSVNGRSDSDLSMHSCPSIPEWTETRSKKARYHSPSPSPPVERKWKRHPREKKQSSSSKRQRDGNGCESSGSSGSEMAQSSYLHNRKWKRPRYENLMSAQGRSLRRQPRDG